jgi:metal transporter CNNM
MQKSDRISSARCPVSRWGSGYNFVSPRALISPTLSNSVSSHLACITSIALLIITLLTQTTKAAIVSDTSRLLRRDVANIKLNTVTAAATSEDDELLEAGSSEFIWTLVLAIFVIMLNGLIAGLILGFMSLDTTNLQVIATSGTEQQKRWAKRIMPIRKRGNLLLVSLLLCNTLMNETIPILMNRVLPSGVAAVLVSTCAVFIFSELLPQAICARHNLRVSAIFAWPVKILICCLFILSWPISKLLDWMLGKDEGVIYRRAELKELVAIHGDHRDGPLTKDEVTIIRGALDLQSKTAASVMTHMNDVFSISIDDRLNRETMSSIVEAGHSRVPVYDGEPSNIVGVVLVKSFIMLDPDDGIPVRDVRINPLPHVSSATPLYDMLNKFQEGSSK